MPCKPTACQSCGNDCRGKRCQPCYNVNRKGKHRYDVKPQAPVVVTELVKVEESWWTKAKRDGFTETAKHYVKPLPEKVKAYNWQTVPL